jgi:hypothetical protein
MPAEPVEEAMNDPLDATHWSGADLDRLFDAADRDAKDGDRYSLVVVMVHGVRLRLLRMRMAGVAPFTDYAVIEPHDWEIEGLRTAGELLAAIDAELPEPTPAQREREQLAAAIASGTQPPLFAEGSTA